MLQDIMHNNSISVVEEPVFEPALTHTEPDPPLTPRTPTSAALPALPNGSLRYPSLGDASSHPSSRHPSVGSARLPSVGEESTHPLLLPDDSVRGHTYVNTTGLLEDPHGASDAPAPHSPPAVEGDEGPQPPEPGPRVQLETEGVRFVLGPTPVQRQLMARERQQDAGRPNEGAAGAIQNANASANTNGNVATQPRQATSEQDGSTTFKKESGRVDDAPDQLNGPIPVPVPAPVPAVYGPSRRRARPPPLSPDANVNNSAQRRTALLDYENLPALPPLREDPKAGSEDEDESLRVGKQPQPLNGFTHNHRGQCSPDHAHLYINTENVTAPPSSGKLESARWRDRSAPSVFSFEFRRPCEPHVLNYIEVETEPERERGSDSSAPQTPKTPTSPLPQTPTRRTELYAVIDVERTAAMSNLQKALPRYDGTSRKTRHNSVDLPM
ncbi:fibroblast growth factor receptor substrate 2b isoform X2 [Salminus brasiliensis]